MTLFQCDRCKVITTLAGIVQGAALQRDLCISCKDDLIAWLGNGVTAKTTSPDSIGTITPKAGK